MLYDCFLINDELDILDWRLRLQEPFVDRFVIVEGTRTFRGEPKPLHFADNRDRFSAFADKIQHVLVDDFPVVDSPWLRELHQRRAMAAALVDVRPSDWVIIGDVDEMLRPQALNWLRSPMNQGSLVGFRLRRYHFRLNYMQVAGRETHEVWPIAVRGDRIPAFQSVGASPANWAQAVRDIRIPLHYQPERFADSALCDEAGWHFSYLGPAARIRAKMSAISHIEYDGSANRAVVDDLENSLLTGRDVYLDDQQVWGAVPLDHSYPACVLDDLCDDPGRRADLLVPMDNAIFAATRARWSTAVGLPDPGPRGFLDAVRETALLLSQRMAPHLKMVSLI